MVLFLYGFVWVLSFGAVFFYGRAACSGRPPARLGNGVVWLLVTLPEAKEYLRVDAEDEDALILRLLGAAQEICMDVARVSSEDEFSGDMDNARAAVLYAVAYLYEHREEADHRGLMLTLRALLFGVRREGF